MLLLLIALQASAPPQETKATLQSCETTEKGWVCHYQIPAATIVRPLDGPPPPMIAAPAASQPAVSQPPVSQPAPPELAAPAKPQVTASIDGAEVGRQTRLIARCADAKWYSPCLPGERKEARTLREGVALRGKVTTLLSEQRCDQAVKVALEGGDLGLAREAREFCAAPH